MKKKKSVKDSCYYKVKEPTRSSQVRMQAVQLQSVERLRLEKNNGGT